MIFWLDAQLPPGLAAWLTGAFQVEARCLQDIGPNATLIFEIELVAIK